MKTFKGIRIVMMSVIALIVFSFASRAVAAIDAFIWFTDSSGKAVKVKINPDGSFATGALHEGTYRWSFGATQSGAMSASTSGSKITTQMTATATKPVLSRGGNPTESVSLAYSVTVNPQLQPSHDASGAATSGKRMHKPFSVMKMLDKSSPKLMTNLGTFVIDVNGDGLRGTVVVKNKKGGITAMDDWCQ